MLVIIIVGRIVLFFVWYWRVYILELLLLGNVVNEVE